MKRTRFHLALLAAGLALAGCVFTAGAYFRDLERARERVTGKSEIAATPFGTLEYALKGEGSPLLMIHGTGGGFDQGLAFSLQLSAQGHRIIAPSRFGYLRSSYPPDPSSQNQADAFVSLLDSLGLDKVAVAGGSAGALSAAHFALRHPDRTSALILLMPAANVRGRDPVEMSAVQEFAVRRLLSSDLLFWLALKIAPETLMGTLLATDPRLLNTVSPAERRRASAILENLMPISARRRGMLNDAKLAGHPARMDFSRITVPTLVISAEDDRFGTAATARDIAAAIPGAKLLIFKKGGHIWLGHDRKVANAISEFLTAPEKLH